MGTLNYIFFKKQVICPVSQSLVELFPRGRFKRISNEYERKRIDQLLPPSYKKFWTEWQDTEGKPIHWEEKTGNYEVLPDGKVVEVQNVPIPLLYPPQMHQGIWGGEGVIEGKVKKPTKNKYCPPLPRFFVPSLRKSVVKSDILDKYLSVVCTERALRLVDEHHGLDDYLLTTPTYELKSLLAIKLKKEIMLKLYERRGIDEEATKLAEKYKEFLIPLEDLEWFGLSFDEAIAKRDAQIENERNHSVPLKIQLRNKRIEELSQQTA